MIKIILLMFMPSLCLAHYDADLLRVIDGDTVLFNIYTLPGQQVSATVRLDQIDTPEKRGTSRRKVPACEKVKAGEAAAFTLEKITKAQRVQVSGLRLGTYASRAKDEAGDKLPSYLGRVLLDGQSLNDLLLQHGHAQPYTKDRRAVFWCLD